MKLLIILLTFFIVLNLNQALDAKEKIENQCLTMDQLEVNYPEYAEKSLIKRFSTEKIMEEGSYGKVIQATLNQKEIVIKNIDLRNKNYTQLVSNELEILEKIKDQPHLFQFYLCVYDPSKNFVYIFTEKLYQNLENLRKKFKKKKKVKDSLYTLKSQKL